MLSVVIETSKPQTGYVQDLFICQVIYSGYDFNINLWYSQTIYIRANRFCVNMFNIPIEYLQLVSLLSHLI